METATLPSFFVKEGKTIYILHEECVYQDHNGADYEYYCSDGNVYSRSFGYESAGSYRFDRRPLWKAGDGRLLTAEKMTESHKQDLIQLLRKDLRRTKSKAKAEFWLAWLGAWCSDCRGNGYHREFDTNASARCNHA